MKTYSQEKAFKKFPFAVAHVSDYRVILCKSKREADQCLKDNLEYDENHYLISSEGWLGEQYDATNFEYFVDSDGTPIVIK